MAHYTSPPVRTFSVAPGLGDHQIPPVWNTAAKPIVTLYNPTVYDPRRNATSPTIKADATAQSWRVISPPTAPTAPTAPTTSTALSTTTMASPSKSVHPPSVKHLTCYFWAKNGNCKWSDDECLYAHHETGKIANGPMQVEPGKPAVAGKNATTARPVYEDWRGGMDSSNNSSSSRRTTIDPEIQKQISYIASKARAHGFGNDSMPPKVTSRKHRQSEATSPLANDTQRYPQVPYWTYPEHLRWQQIQTLAAVTDVLTTVVQYSQELFDKAAGTLQYEAQALEDVFNDIAPIPINGCYPPIPYLQNLLGSRRNILNAMNELERMGTCLHDARVSIIKDLEEMDLMSVAPDWSKLHHFGANGVNFPAPH